MWFTAALDDFYVELLEIAYLDVGVEYISDWVCTDKVDGGGCILRFLLNWMVMFNGEPQIIDQNSEGICTVSYRFI